MPYRGYDPQGERRIMLTIKHRKILTLPDDSNAIARGEVLPSNWNDSHEIVGDVGLEFIQVAPSATWTINHNLGYRPSVELLTAGGAEMEGEILHVSVNQLQIYFTVSVAGSARLV